MQDPSRTELVPGLRVEVTQQIPHRDKTWTNMITGTVVSYDQRQTGSWYAHSKNDKLWLDRLMLRKDDGEVTVLILDDYTHVKVLGPSAEPAAAANAPATGDVTSA